MKIGVRNDKDIPDSRFLWASIFIVLVTGGLLLRLWYLQVFQGDYYSSISERNRVRRVDISVPRGVIYDRTGQVVLGNRPFFDLVYVPQYVKDRAGTFRILSRLMNIPVSTFERRFISSRGRPRFLPVILKRNLTLHQVSVIENNKVFLPGIEVKVEARREYSKDVPTHMVGYLREVDRETLQGNNELFKDNPYLPGDLMGKQGLELRWEKYLRGRRGYRLVQVDAFGRQTKLFAGKSFEYPVTKAEAGSDLELTLDFELQKEVKKAFSGKNGAVVVLNPRNGEILAELSEPGFDPELMQTGLSREEWRRLSANPYKPFLDKTTGGEFSPGSIFKPVVAMAALEEGVITPRTQFNCTGSFTLGNHTFYCYHRTGHGLVDLKRAIMKSCDIFFYHVGVELGVDRIAAYARAFGLGKKLGVNLNMERPGLIPDSAWKRMVRRFPWTKGDTPSVAIGQGYVLMTPMQMATLYAAIATNGKVYKPFLVRKVTNHVGKTLLVQEPELVTEVKTVKPSTYALIRDYLKAVVMDPEGTGNNAQIEDHTVAGKTGSVQVVSLKKNRNQMDVSSFWKEHAIFASFSPAENAEVVVVVMSQHDKIGGGGKAAAPVAQRILRKYWDLKEQRAANRLNLSSKESDANHALHH